MADVDAILFPNRAGTYLRVTTWKRRGVDRATRSVGIDGMTDPRHDLRHTAASLSIASGASVKVVQHQLGHRSATLTLDVYGHLYGDDLDALSSALDDLNSRAPADSVRDSRRVGRRRPDPSGSVLTCNFTRGAGWTRTTDRRIMSPLL